MSNHKSIDDYLKLKNVGGTSGQNWNSDSRDRGILLISFRLAIFFRRLHLEIFIIRNGENRRGRLIIHEMSFGIKYITIGKKASFLPHYTNLIKFPLCGVLYRSYGDKNIKRVRVRFLGLEIMKESKFGLT